MNLGEILIQKIDDYLEQNAENLKCSEISDLYFSTTNAVTKLDGNPDNLTGLTEFIIYRLLVNLNQSKLNSGEIKIASKGSIGKRNPDIIVYRDLRPIYSIQVKSNYYKVAEDYDRHLQVIRVQPDIKVATLAFEVRTPSHLKQIEEHKKLNSRYQCLVLKDNNQMVNDALMELGLIF